MPLSTFGQRLVWAQDRAGLTNVQLATQVGRHRVTVSQWRRGKYRPEGEELERLAVALGVAPGWLAYGTGPAPGGVPGSMPSTPEGASREFVAGILFAVEQMQGALAELMRAARETKPPAEG